MSDLVPVRRALLSVSDKTDVIPFARGLSGLGIEIVSTGGTAAALAAAGVSVQSVEAVTGFPEMMDGRVKTLHPAIHGALLGRRDNPEHVASMKTHGIVPIDLVCVNLYPFERTVASGDVSFEQAVEQIDIGGPAMVRSAAKNHDSVAVVTDPRQYDRVMNELLGHDGATTLALRRELAEAAFRRTAEYDLAISAWMGRHADQGFPQTLRLTYLLDQELRYGENPHQRAALYREPVIQGATIAAHRVLHGKTLSYNNINDAAAALDLGRDLFDLLDGGPAAAIIKHTNPCGAARADTMREAFEKAFAGDPLAAYGGILVLGGVADARTADAICEGDRFFEVIVAERLRAGGGRCPRTAVEERAPARVAVRCGAALAPGYSARFRADCSCRIPTTRWRSRASGSTWPGRNRTRRCSTRRRCFGRSASTSSPTPCASVATDSSSAPARARWIA